MGANGFIIQKSGWWDHLAWYIGFPKALIRFYYLWSEPILPWARNWSWALWGKLCVQPEIGCAWPLLSYWNILWFERQKRDRKYTPFLISLRRTLKKSSLFTVLNVDQIEIELPLQIYHMRTNSRFISAHCTYHQNYGSSFFSCALRNKSLCTTSARSCLSIYGEWIT